MDGNHAILQQLIADGFEYMFGLPGTEEEGFLDALTDYKEKLKYILCYQESIAVMAADGYARATGRPGLVQIHSTPGLANALGAIWEAKKGNSPLVVLGGKAGLRYVPLEAHMSGDVLGLARPVTKWCGMVTHPTSTLRMLRRAYCIACTPPRGPVYLCLPMDVLDEECPEGVRQTYVPSTRTAPEEGLVRQAAEMLLAARQPRIFIGDGVVAARAEQALQKVAEILGAPVWSVHQGDLPMDMDHPLFQGFTGRMFGYDSKKWFQEGDVNLLCGTYAVPEVFPELGPVFADGAKVIHIDLDAENIGKNHPLDLGMVADPKTTLELLSGRLDAMITEEAREAATERIRVLGEDKKKARAKAIAADQDTSGSGLLAFAAVAKELAKRIPESAVIFDESLTCSGALTRYLTPRGQRRYFIPRGGCLGIGLPSAIGAKVGVPQMVIGITGDGGAMEVIQCLATAARHDIHAKLIVCNNRSYRVCEYNLTAYRAERHRDLQRPQPGSFNLATPDLDFALMAKGQGVRSARLEEFDEIGPRIQEMIDHAGPFLLEVVAE
jgi:benzoylformate decarboxylase